MTSPELLTRVLFLLDDIGGDYWTEDDVYVALNSASLEIFKRALAVFMVKGGKLLDILRPFVKETSAVPASQQNGFPGDLEHLISAKYQHDVQTMTSAALPVKIQDQNDNFYTDRDNPYLKGDNSNPIGWYGTKSDGTSCLELEVTDTDYGMIRLVYIKTPATITAAQNPQLREYAHESMAQYAFSSMLLKDKRYSAAASEMKKFESMFPGVIQ